MQRKPLIRRLVVTLAACALATWAFTASASAQPQPGDILVIDPDVPPVSTAVLFQVDPQTGARTVLNDFGTGSPSAVAVEVDGGILVTDTAAGTDPSGGTSEWGVLYRLSPDPVTGELVRTILTDFGVGPNTGRHPRAVTVEPDGQILVTTGIPGTLNNRALLVRVDPVTGARAIVSDFGDSSQGGLGVEPRGVAVEAGGQILVIDAQGGTSALGELFRVDPQTGARTSVSNFGAGPLNGINPTSVAVEANGQILVTDEGHGSLFPLGLLLRIDPQTGVRTILSDLNIVPNTGREPEGVAVEANGQILVIDKHAGPLTRGMLFRVDPQTGDRQIVSDFGTGANQGGDPLALAIVPPVVVPPSQATLVVVNEVVNDNGGTAVASDWATTVTGGNPAPASFQGASAPGTTVTLDAGSYDVTESGPSGYTASFSADCSGTIAADEIRTCTITNDDQPATLTVVTEVINDNGGTLAAGDFTISVTATNPTPASFPGQGPPGTTVTLDPGNYDVGIFPRPGYAITAFSPDCSSTIANGETKTCTITANDIQPPTLTVITEVINDNGGTLAAGDFTISVTATNPTPASFPGQGPPGTTVTLDPGNYDVGIFPRPGYAITAFSPDCSSTIANGETKTCTITANDQPPAVPTCDGLHATIVGGPGSSELVGTSGDDVIVDLDGDNVVRGFGGDDTVCTGPGNDRILVGGGADTVIDTGGNNTVDGGAGADIITTGTGADSIRAGGGNDTVIDTGGDNIADGGAGNDTITTGAGNDTIDGGPGFDRCTPSTGHNIVTRCEAIT